MMRKIKNQFIIRGLTAVLLVVGLGSSHCLTPPKKQTSGHDFVSASREEGPPTDLHAGQGRIEPAVPSFVDAVGRATPAVVHITAKRNPKVIERYDSTSPLEEFFREFFGRGFESIPREYQSQPISATGSGVIISGDGHIVTNNHVVEGADELEVTLDDNRRYVAKIVGTDPDTDLALIKIEEKNLSYLSFGDSDKLQVGEWVLAVGNPFNLTSTVTKGIVSAKARSPKLYKAGASIKIESFIQTDAAINPGNSGGALVNLQGELVGMNTAISTPTGTFVGYGFAIPSSIAMRVVQDLRAFGVVQRAMLGIYPKEVDADLAAEKQLKRFTGIYVAKLAENSPAAKAGLQQGDVIIAIDSHPIKSLAQVYEQLARYQPNDKVSVTFDRKGKEITIQVILTSPPNKVKFTPGQNILSIAGATFENIDEAMQQKLGLTGGVQVKALKGGKWQQAGIKKGFIIRTIDKQPVESIAQLASILSSKEGGILVEGIYPNGMRGYYALGWDDE